MEGILLKCIMSEGNKYLINEFYLKVVSINKKCMFLLA